MVSYWNQPRSVKERCLSWGGSLALYLAMASNLFIWDSHLWMGCLFEMDASTIKSQVIHLHYKKEKNNCQGLHYNVLVFPSRGKKKKPTYIV